MPLLAYTKTGNHCLVAGLILHAAALMVGMMTAAGAEAFFQITYPASCVLFAAGGFAELCHREMPPLRGWRFYILAAATVFPVLGPLTVLALVYSSPWKNGSACGPGLNGFFAAGRQLKPSVAVVGLLLLLLFILFAVLAVRTDPYFTHHKKLSAAAPFADEKTGRLA
jgi:hypothetical protein